MTQDIPQVRQRVRHDPSERMPEYSHDVEAAYEWACLDKLTITFPTSYLQGTGDNVGEIVADLCNTPWFSPKSNRRLLVREALGFPKPLLSGNVAFKYDPRNRRYACRITLRPNLTRIIAHLEGRRPSTLEPEELVDRIFEPDEDQRTRLSAISLDVNDNLLPPYRTWNMRRIDWGHELTFVVHALFNFITHMIAVSAGQFAGARFRRSFSDWYISNCEIYWEFRSPNALTQVRFIADRLERLSASVDRRLYVPIERTLRLSEYNEELVTEEVAEDGRLRPSVARRGSALEVVMEGGRQNVLLAVYAKTADRIRFEVRYTRKVRDFIPRAYASEAGSNQTLYSIPNLISTLIEVDASPRMNAVLDGIAALSVPVTGETEGLSRLLTEFASACHGNEALLDALITSLCVHGCLYQIAQRGRKRATDRLVRRGVLRRGVVHRHGRGPTLVPTASFVGVVDALRRALGDLGNANQINSRSDGSGVR